MYPVGEGGGGTQSNCSEPNPSEDTVYLVGEGGGTQSYCSKSNPSEDTVYPVGEGGGALSLTVVSLTLLRTQCTL